MESSGNLPKELQIDEDSKTARRLKRRAVSFVPYNRHPVLKRFGACMRTRRQNLGLTQQDLATTTHISRSSISAIETGVENLSLERAQRIADALSIPLSDLLCEKDHPEAHSKEV